MTSHGVRRSNSRSLNVPGSLSSALQTTYFTLPGAPRTADHFFHVGKPAPPMPRSVEVSSFLRSGRVFPALDVLANRVVARFALVDVDLPSQRPGFDMLVRQLFLVEQCLGAHDGHAALLFGRTAIDVMVVDEDRNRPIALPQAGDAADFDAIGVEVAGKGLRGFALSAGRRGCGRPYRGRPLPRRSAAVRDDRADRSWPPHGGGAAALSCAPTARAFLPWEASRSAPGYVAVLVRSFGSMSSKYRPQEYIRQDTICLEMPCLRALSAANRVRPVRKRQAERPRPPSATRQRQNGPRDKDNLRPIHQ